MCIATEQNKMVRLVLTAGMDHESFVRQARKYGLKFKKEYLRTCDSSVQAVNQLRVNRFYTEHQVEKSRKKILKKVEKHLVSKNGLTKRVNRFRGDYLFTPGGK